MRTPRAAAAAVEERHELPAGRDRADERFAGYGVIAQPFRSGHVLALRRFPGSSIGPGYTSVWHRDPEGRWTFRQDQPEERACPRYFSRALSATRRTPVGVEWTDERTMRVTADDAGLDWRISLEATPATRLLSLAGTLLPERAWRADPVLAVMGRVAGAALGAGRVALGGGAPNGHRFVVGPVRVWAVAETSASLEGVSLGAAGPLTAQTRLGDLWIPQRGIFAVGRAVFTPPPGAVTDADGTAGTGRSPG